MSDSSGTLRNQPLPVAGKWAISVTTDQAGHYGHTDQPSDERLLLVTRQPDSDAKLLLAPRAIGKANHAPIQSP